MGALSDNVGRKPLLITATLLGAVLAYPLMSWLVWATSFGRLLTVELLLAAIYVTYNSAFIVLLTEIIPAHVRTVGFSLAYSLATAVFGGLTPAISTALIGATGNKAILGAWCTAACLVSPAYAQDANEGFQLKQVVEDQRLRISDLERRLATMEKLVAAMHSASAQQTQVAAAEPPQAPAPSGRQRREPAPLGRPLPSDGYPDLLDARLAGQQAEFALSNRLNDRGIDGSSGTISIPFIERNVVGQGIIQVRGFFGLGAAARVYGKSRHIGLQFSGDDVSNPGTGTAYGLEGGLFHRSFWAYGEMG